VTESQHRSKSAGEILPPDVDIAEVTGRNIGLLAHVDADVFDEPVDSERLRAYVRAPDHLMVVAVHKGTVIAQVAAVLHRHPDKVTELYIDEVGVTPNWRRKGLATAMLVRVLDEGRLRGAREAWVGTEPGNAAAHRLYKNLGGPEAERFVMYVLPMEHD
jgi:aminoglycoside 6'-N-acetyltransferase I